MHTGRYVMQPMLPTQPKSPSACGRDLTRERILDAAFAEIQRQGFQAASVSAILSETGLTKGALYHHFPCKKELGLAVVDERVAGVLGGHILDLLVTPDTDPAPLNKLLDLLAAAQDSTADAIRLGCPLNNLMQEMSALDEDFRHHLTAIVTRWQQRVETLLRQAQAQGQVRADVDCQAVALFVVAAWEGAASIAKNLQSLPAFTASMEQLTQFVRQLQTG